MIISLIIPALGNPLSLKKVINAIQKQTLQPNEIVIVDSSPNDEVENLSLSFQAQLPIKYFRVKSLYPGEARNFGISKSVGDIIATLDSKTIPKEDWLEESIEKINSDEYEISFGSTTYKANLPFQKVLRACIYGKKTVQTLPGSVFLEIHFIESVHLLRVQEVEKI